MQPSGALVEYCAGTECAIENGWLVMHEGGTYLRFTQVGAYLEGTVYWSCVMLHSPSIVPEPDDRDVYLVLDDFGGKLGRAWPETDEERTDRETVIADLLQGQYSDPVRIVAFNTEEGWSRDVSEEISDEIRQRLATEERDAPPSLEGFIERHGSGRPVHLPLPLRGAA